MSLVDGSKGPSTDRQRWTYVLTAEPEFYLTRDTVVGTYLMEYFRSVVGIKLCSLPPSVRNRFDGFQINHDIPPHPNVEPPDQGLRCENW